MTKKISIFFAVMILFFACKKTEQLDGYTRAENGYYFKLLGIGDGNDAPEDKKSVLVFDAVMKTLNDSVFWDTKHDAVNGLFIALNSERIEGSCNSHFSKMVQGDSVSFLIKPSILFKEYFNMIVPPFCKNDSLVKMDVKLNQIISQAEYEALKKNMKFKEVEDTELQELQYIDCYLSSNYKSVKADDYGLYTLEKTETNLEPVAYGKHIKIEYKGYYLDDRPIDGVTQELEMIYGTPDQVIKGLNIVIGTLKKGETTKIIVPSRLAFGELGSSNGSIAPYTPIRYDLKIIDIK